MCPQIKKSSPLTKSLYALLPRKALRVLGKCDLVRFGRLAHGAHSRGFGGVAVFDLAQDASHQLPKRLFAGGQRGGTGGDRLCEGSAFEETVLR